MTFRWIIYIFLLLPGGYAFPQQYYFRHYEVKDGLSDNSIECSIQDKEGFMWFGTKDGLTRFDGTHFKVFTTDSAGQNLYRDFISALAVDQSGTLWVGASRGLFRYNKERERLEQIPDIPSNVYRLEVDRNGLLWIIARSNIYTYDAVTGKSEILEAGRFTWQETLCETKDGKMWFISGDGHIWTINAKSGAVEKYNLYSHSAPAKVKAVVNVAAAGDGTILIGTISQGLKRFNPVTREYTDVITRHSNGSSIFVHDILQTDDEIWLATEKGLLIINEKTGAVHHAVKRFLDPYAISDNAVYTLCKDREGGIWAGTFFGGMNYYPNRQLVFEKYFPDYSPNSIGGNAVREICADSLGHLWIATEDAGITRLEPDKKTAKRFMPDGQPGSISHSNIHGLMAAGHDLWISTHLHGVDVLDIRTGKVRKHYSAGSAPGDLNTEFVLTFLRTRGGTIYLGGASGLLHYFPDKDKFILVPLRKDQPNWGVTTLLEDSKGFIWAGTNGSGLFRHHPRTGESARVMDEADPQRAGAAITAIHEDSAGNIWAATNGNGLWRLKGGNLQDFRRYTTQDGLPANSCYKVLEDDRRGLWITTTKGLVNMDAAGGIRVFTQEDGLLNDQFNFNSGYKAPDGRLYFGSTKGMISFMPSALRRSKYMPPLYITGLQINNKDVGIGEGDVLSRSMIFTDELTLRHDQASVNLDFAAISFTQPEKIVYSYKMEGIDNEWNTLQHNRRVYFTDLKPGHYVFRVRAASPDLKGVYEKQLAIRINPPLWNTIWAYLVYALLLAGLAYYLLRSYHQVQRAKKEKEIIDAKMEFFTNIAHEIRTPLTLIKGPVDNLKDFSAGNPDMKEDLDTMERNTDRLIRLVNQVLDFRHTEAKGFSLNFEPVNITHALAGEFEAFRQQAQKRGLRFELFLPPKEIVMLADADALYKIFSNLIGNAVKYGATSATVSLLSPASPGWPVTVEVANDGPQIPADLREKIFEPFFRLKGAAARGTGIGLTLARSLAELHGGSLHFHAGDGTLNTFILIIPNRPETA